MERIDVRQLSGEKTLLRQVESVKSLGLENEQAFQSPVTVDVSVRKFGGRVMVEGKLTGNVRLECSRCLESFEEPLEAGVAIQYLEGPAPEVKADVVRDDDPDRSYYEPPFIDMTDDFRQILLLEVPAFPVCSTGCRGLCPTCGAVLNRGACGCGTGAGASAPAVQRLDEAMHKRRKGNG